jgi:prolyl-tRNA synthetase
MKAVLFETDSSDGGRVLVLALVRGDLEASDVKIRNHLKARFLLPAQDDFIRSFGIIPGFASPVGIAPRKDLVVLVDKSIAEGNNFVGGANEEDHHLVNVNFGRDFTSENVGDFAKAESGHLAPDGKSRLKAVRGIEIGNIFKLGTKFTESMNCAYLDEAGKHQVPIMGCYGIGVGRLMAAAIENSHDDFGPIWPSEITPYHVHLVNIGQEPEVVAACEALMAELEGAGIEVLYDDRDERPGVKFKDADLWGIPVRVAIGKKTLANEAGPSVEWKLRREKEFSLVPVGDVQTKLLEWYASTCVREQG